MFKQNIKTVAFLFVLFTITFFTPSGIFTKHNDAPIVPAPIVTQVTHKPKRAQVSEIDCLAKNIYYEARGEDDIGKIAVGLVTLNRVDSPSFPKSICRVVNQQTSLSDGTILCQFSWVCDVTRVPVGVAWKNSKEIAKMLLSRNHAHIELVPDAVFFHSTAVKPAWRKKKTQVAKIGNHIFYK